jgi:hypothetical protein
MSEGLAKARLKLAELKASGQSVERLDPIEKAKRNPGSLRLAVNGKCWDCCGAGADGLEHTKQTIRECACTRCPLHPVRPYQPDLPEAA